MRRSRYVPLALTFLVAVAAAGCDGAPAAAPEYSRIGDVELLAACAPAAEQTVTVTAGTAGAHLTGAGIELAIPAGALAGPTQFEVRVPASTYAEVEIRANGQDHFQFLLPVVISIGYDRCGTPSGQLSAWHIDPETKVLLENMGGVHDEVNRRVTFSTMHLSGYAIAN